MPVEWMHEQPSTDNDDRLGGCVKDSKCWDYQAKDSRIYGLWIHTTSMYWAVYRMLALFLEKGKGRCLPAWKW